MTKDTLDRVIKKGQELTRDVLEKLRHSDILRLRVKGSDDEDVERDLWIESHRSFEAWVRA